MAGILRKLAAALGRGPLQNNTLEGGGTGIGGTGLSTYSGSSVTDASSDFLGDWRAVDSWQRFDIWRVRNRSRQLWNGNPYVRSFGRWLVSNVLGAKGIHQKVRVMKPGGKAGDDDGGQDEPSEILISAARDRFEKARNFTTRKNLSREDADALLIRELACDGEIILRKRRGFDNDFGFAWQIVNPDYLDHNLNRVQDNGNIIKMGVELDKDDKFPVAYWFLYRRPNDYFYNYSQWQQQRYERVLADEVLHIYIKDIDNEQTRGWPWVFAAMVNLFRSDKYAEAALINATVGAMKSTWFTKKYPEGFEAPPEDTDARGNIVQYIGEAGSATELPVGVEPVNVDFKYPDGDMEPFVRVMARGMATAIGPSYASLTGDFSDSNFSSSRMGQDQEREFATTIAEFFIREWKEPDAEEWIFRWMLLPECTIPLAQFDLIKFIFQRRGWPYLQPLQDMQAVQLLLDCQMTNVIDEIEKRFGVDGAEQLRKNAACEKLMKELNLVRITSQKTPANDGSAEASNPQQPGGDNQPPPADDDEHDPTIGNYEPRFRTNGNSLI